MSLIPPSPAPKEPLTGSAWRYLAGAVLFALWAGVIVLRHYFPDQSDSCDDLLSAIRYTLTALGAFHLTVFNPPTGGKP